MSKEDQIDSLTANQILLRALEKERSGPLLSRGCVRCLDPIRKMWYVWREINDAKDLLFDPEQAVAVAWRISWHDMV